MRFWWILAAATCALAQTEGPAPPPELDEALRARVKIFFDAHVAGKFRVADSVVAEDSKDAFFEANKPRYLGYEIKSVKYAEDFMTAQVVVDCATELTMPTGAKINVKIPRTTRWKFADTQWFWTADPSSAKQTPFGPMQPPPQPGQPGAPGPISKPPSGPTEQGAAAEIEQGLSIDKFELHLKTDAESSDAITIDNRLGGWVQVSGSVPKTPGLTVKVDKNIKPGSKGQVVFAYTPGPEAPPRAVGGYLTLLPLEQTHAFKIIFDGPRPEKPAALQVAPPQAVETVKPAGPAPAASTPAPSAPAKGKKKPKK